jgi:hypothetical protein
MPLPSGSPHLEQLRKQAKDLLRAFRAADSRARSRMAAHLPQVDAHAPVFADGRMVRLAHAQFVVAREHGFPSWPRLKASVVDAADQQLAPAQPAETSMGYPVSLPGSRPLAQAARAQALLVLSRELVDLARRRDVVGLAARLSQMPRRDLLAVRALLVERGEHAVLVDGLLEGLKSTAARVRHDCAHALDHFADARCARPLRHLLDDPVPRVRRVTLHVLSCDVCKLSPLPADDDLTALVIHHALTDPSINVRRHATVALGACSGDARAIQVLEMLATRETDPAIRREARGARRRCQARSCA